MENNNISFAALAVDMACAADVTVTTVVGCQRFAAQKSLEASWTRDDLDSICFRMTDYLLPAQLLDRATRIQQLETNMKCEQILSAIASAKARKLMGIEA